MKINEIKERLLAGALSEYSALYTDIPAETERFIKALDTFAATYGSDRDVAVFSVPGRSEIIGNHTDHNHGKVMAAAISRDIIAIAAKNSDGVIRFRSEGYSEDSVRISDSDDPKKFKSFTSRALVAGMVNGFTKEGFAVGGYDAYSTTEVLKGSGLSSSAAFEVMVGNILNHFYNGGKVSAIDIAKLAQYSENVFFGKPCGLMDQMACAVGGFVYIDFAKKDSPYVEPVSFSLTDRGYSLCIVNTGGNHSALNNDYAAVPSEMKAVAAIFNKEVLLGLTEADILAKMPVIREKCGDRAALRALHFVRECNRVDTAKEALLSGDVERFLHTECESGRSSFCYLQNVYTNHNPEEQGISLALAVTDGYLANRIGAYRVHGGGFAGTIQTFLRKEDLADYVTLMDSVFGKGAAMPLIIRPLGASKLFG